MIKNVEMCGIVVEHLHKNNNIYMGKFGKQYNHM